MSSVQSTSSTEAAPRRFKAIIFDLLTALLDSWTLWESCIPSGSSCTGHSWRERYLAITFNQGSYSSYASLVHEAARDVGLPASAAEALLNNWYQLESWPEVPDIIQKLRSSGMKLVVLTNCSSSLGHQAVNDLCRIVEERSGEPFAFDVVITAEESDWYKPHHKAYEAGLKALNMDPEEVLFVAGSAGDVAGATNAGMKVAWNNHIGLVRYDSVEPLREGRSLEEALRGII
ncbi:hypothetical protein AAFC00_006140 [Neodothiora populina]|uniref:Uncharacterized protein n=1 Tax=Neodothiora populina TaxID=2781224 RepID=A0ABR3P4I0_9PEZI